MTKLQELLKVSELTEDGLIKVSSNDIHRVYANCQEKEMPLKVIDLEDTPMECSDEEFEAAKVKLHDYCVARGINPDVVELVK